MATTNTTQYNNRANGVLQDGRIFGGTLHRFRVDVDFASQAAADIINLFHLPREYQFAFGVANTDTSTSTATFSIGIAGTTAKFRALAALTTTDTPVFFGKQAPTEEAERTTGQDIILTWAAASAPASGNMTLDFYASKVA